MSMLKPILIPFKAMSHEVCLAKLDKDGKPGATVFQHSSLTAEVAREYIKLLDSRVRNLLPKGLLTLIALHDLGKISIGFQLRICKDFYSYIMGEIPPGEFEYLHAVIGGKSLEKIGNGWELILIAHHGATTEDNLGRAGCFKYGGEEWEIERQKFIRLIFDTYGEFDFSQPINPISLFYALAITTISDWIASGNDFDQSKDGFENNYERVKEVVAKRFSENPQIVKGLSFEKIFGFKPNDLQQKAIKVCNRKGLYIIEDSMGGGKTEVAEWMAYSLIERGENDGLYFALPTKMTSNMIYERVAEFLKKAFINASPSLIHGDSWMKFYDCDTSTAKESGLDEWFRPSKRAILTKYGVGTLDSAILSICNSKHNYIRTFGLANKVIIIDEVHCYDFYTSALIEKFIDQCEENGCSVIMLSATLTDEKKKLIFGDRKQRRYNNYPIISYCYYGEDKVKYSFPKSSKKIDVVVRHIKEIDYDQIIERYNKGDKIAIIMNSVADVQECYKGLMERMGIEEEIDILHSWYTISIRRNKEERCVRIFGKKSIHGRGAILCSTQIVEQSLDIDFDVIYTNICPIDILLQRIGRLWRHLFKTRRDGIVPEIFIIQSEKSNNFIYDKYVMARTKEIVDGLETISIPKDIKKLIESVYKDREESSELKTLKRKMIENKESLEKIAISSTKSFMPMSSGEEKGFSRHSQYPSKTLLLTRGYRIIEDGIEISLINGETAVLKKIFSSKEKIKIHHNIVDIPFGGRMKENFIDIESQLCPEICKILPIDVDCLVVLDSENNIFYDNGLTRPAFLKWSNTLGIEKIRKK